MIRYRSIDALRGTGVLGLVFLHSSVYFYGSIDEVDMSNPPILIAIIGVLALWGGVFALISGTVNTLRSLDRRKRGDVFPRKLFFTSLALILLHFGYSFFLSPTSFDFDTGLHSYSWIQILLRPEVTGAPSMIRLLEGSALLMLGLNLLVLSILLPLIFRARRPHLLALLLTLGFTGLGPLRFLLAPIYETALEQQEFLGALLITPFAAKPYPLFPYLGFALMGSLFGISLHFHNRPPKEAWVLGVSLLVLGAGGFFLFPVDLTGAGPFWFSKTLFELGVFTLILRILLIKEPKDTSILQQAGRMSLTIFLLQMPVSELLGLLLTLMIPGWNLSLEATLLFAAGNIMLWLLLIPLWTRSQYRFTVEQLWVKLSPRSTKLLFPHKGSSSGH